MGKAAPKTQQKRSLSLDRQSQEIVAEDIKAAWNAANIFSAGCPRRDLAQQAYTSLLELAAGNHRQTANTLPPGGPRTKQEKMAAYLEALANGEITNPPTLK